MSITKKCIKQHILKYHTRGGWKYNFATLEIIHDNGEDLTVKLRRKYIPSSLGFSYIAMSSNAWEDYIIDIPYLQYTKKKENQII